MLGLTLDLLTNTTGNLTDKKLPYEEGEEEGVSCLSCWVSQKTAGLYRQK